MNEINMFHVEQRREPARLRLVTDPQEIASIERSGLDDIIGAQDSRGNWWAYSWSLERWRAAPLRSVAQTCDRCGGSWHGGSPCTEYTRAG